MRAPPRRTAAAAVITGLAMTGCGSSQPAAPPQLAALDRLATAEDVLPDGRELPLEEYSNLRRIGEVDGALVYAAQGTAEHPWWMVIVLDGPAEDDAVAGGSWANDEDFTQRGITVSIGRGAGQGVTATLLPDDFTGQLEDGSTIIGPNLAVPAKP
ncbi:hypothetical protein [Georgenia sp. SYP-B2076]|uniref:hypothetical protein n=1 Tax=Georgenia sp. SYP-B2076 TaxID=2495881 RepID=UPI000F8E1800|nr:hypothetical protein [Georgenia sp. SYP-B2076]